jgi:hypothetical protein
MTDEQQKEFPLQIVSGKNEQVQVVPLITTGSSSSAQIEPELILSKVQPLSAYLNKLLKFHEIVASDEFLLFLDEEAKDMKSNVKNLEALSIHDILLMRVSYNKCTVRKSEEASFKVLKGQIVVWQFSTEGYDIGFSVSVNGQTKISLTRYNSHQKVASGSLEVTEDGKVESVFEHFGEKQKLNFNPVWDDRDDFTQRMQDEAKAPFTNDGAHDHIHSHEHDEHCNH